MKTFRKVKGKLFFAILCLWTASCSNLSMVSMQEVYVDSEPFGATVYADGFELGETPSWIKLERNSNHLITLKKEGYHHLSVYVVKRYLDSLVMRKALEKGMHSAVFFNDRDIGFRKAESSIEEDKKNGSAYELIPQAISVVLLPKDGKTDEVISSSASDQRLGRRYGL